MTTMTPKAARAFWLALVDNAARILLEADVLFPSPRAQSLAVVAQEELGKAVWVYRTFCSAWSDGDETPREVPALRREGRAHIAKLLEAADFSVALLEVPGSPGPVEIELVRTHAPEVRTWRASPRQPGKAEGLLRRSRGRRHLHGAPRDPQAASEESDLGGGGHDPVVPRRRPSSSERDGQSSPPDQRPAGAASSRLGARPGRVGAEDARSRAASAKRPAPPRTPCPRRPPFVQVRDRVTALGYGPRCAPAAAGTTRTARRPGRQPVGAGTLRVGGYFEEPDLDAVHRPGQRGGRPPLFGPVLPSQPDDDRDSHVVDEGHLVRQLGVRQHSRRRPRVLRHVPRVLVQMFDRWAHPPRRVARSPCPSTTV